MQALKFNINGKFACFRKPETNSSIYLTYSCIHKVALLGILGSIIGLKGYNQTKKEKGKIILPEFYEKLKNLKISIVAPKDNIVHHTMIFNNSTGIGSMEEGGNLIVKETVLSNPSWDIYIMDDGSNEYKTIKDYLLTCRSKFIPYLGRNDYMANIEDVEIVECEKQTSETLEYTSIVHAELNECIENDGLFVENFLTVEKLPFSLDEKTAHYKYYTFLNTTDYIPLKENTFKCDDKNLFFF